MFKNIFNTPESLRNAFLNQDELRAKSQQGMQAVKSGVESLRTVLANNPVEYSNRDSPGQGNGSGQIRSGFSGSSSSTTPSSSTATGSSSPLSSTPQRPLPNRDQSGSWSFLPPSLSVGKHFQNLSGSSASSSSTAQYLQQPHQPYQGRPGSIKDVAGSITDSVAGSIKSLGNGLKLGQFAEGLGLSGPSGLSSGPGSVNRTRRGTGDLQHHQQHQEQQEHAGPYLKSVESASRSRVWTWNGQDATEEREEGGGAGANDTDSVRRWSASRGKDALKMGAKTEVAAKETEVLLAKLRQQQQDEDLAMEQAKRMPEVEKMAQRYQDSWTEIHNHTASNSDKADDADEILEKVMELCMRHVNASVQLAEGTKDLKNLSVSLDEMVIMSENIQKKLVGLESMIEKLEDEAEVLSLADWKKSKASELDKYMESKRNELWDKAELLSTRSEQFQKEEASRKLRLYQNQFETDMAHFRRTQEEREQELWKIAEAGTDGHTRVVNPTLGERASSQSVSRIQPLEGGDRQGTDAAVTSAQDEEERREKEDLDSFLGPATESDSREDENDDSEDFEDSEEDVYDDEEEEEEEEEETSEDEDDLDPIAKARKARVAAAAAAAKSEFSCPTKGSTISTFSMLASHPSTTSLSRS